MPFPFGRIDHNLGARRHRQARDVHHLGRVVIDRQRHAIIAGQIGRLLALRAAKKVQREVVVGIAYRGRLRPAVRAQRGQRHDPVLVQQRQDLLSDRFVHRSRLPLASAQVRPLQQGCAAGALHRAGVVIFPRRWLCMSQAPCRERMQRPRLTRLCPRRPVHSASASHRH